MGKAIHSSMVFASFINMCDIMIPWLWYKACILCHRPGELQIFAGFDAVQRDIFQDCKLCR